MDNQIKLGSIIGIGYGGSKERLVKLYQVVTNVDEVTKVSEMFEDGVCGGLPGTQMMTETELQDFLNKIEQCC